MEDDAGQKTVDKGKEREKVIIKSKKRRIQINDLDDEILREFALLLTVREALDLQGVCSRWRECFNSQVFWYALVQRDYGYEAPMDSERSWKMLYRNMAQYVYYIPHHNTYNNHITTLTTTRL